MTHARMQEGGRVWVVTMQRVNNCVRDVRNKIWRGILLVVKNAKSM